MLPLRFFAWVGLAGSSVAAFELDRLARDVEDGRARAGIALAISAGVLLVLAGAFLARLQPDHEAVGAVAAQRRELAVAATFLVAAALLCAVLSRRAARAGPARARKLGQPSKTIRRLFGHGHGHGHVYGRERTRADGPSGRC